MYADLIVGEGWGILHRYGAHFLLAFSTTKTIPGQQQTSCLRRFWQHRKLFFCWICLSFFSCDHNFGHKFSIASSWQFLPFLWPWVFLPSGGGNPPPRYFADTIDFWSGQIEVVNGLVLNGLIFRCTSPVFVQQNNSTRKIGTSKRCRIVTTNATRLCVIQGILENSIELPNWNVCRNKKRFSLRNRQKKNKNVVSYMGNNHRYENMEKWLWLAEVPLETQVWLFPMENIFMGKNVEHASIHVRTVDDRTAPRLDVGVEVVVFVRISQL